MSGDELSSLDEMSWIDVRRSSIPAVVSLSGGLSDGSDSDGSGRFFLDASTVIKSTRSAAHSRTIHAETRI
ncbi:MAG TPA: hypothetical protein PKJ53_07590, partial [Spirochaetales bacterium]|nr:hypothetical protein [Spirochaetales bacterium]